MQKLYNWLAREDGQTMAEYGVVLALITLASVVLGYIGYRVFTRGEREAGQGMVGDMAAFDI
jgi:Flp pilus assembly pilin Flp